RRAGLPVEIVKEFDSWRQVRDAEGTTGWVLGSMLSGRRTAVVLPWELKASQSGGASQPVSAALRDDDSDTARPLAYVEAGVPAGTIAREARGGRTRARGFRGYREQVRRGGPSQGEGIRWPRPPVRAADGPGLYGASLPGLAARHQPHHHIDMRYFQVGGRLRQAIDADAVAGDVDQPTLFLDKKVIVIRRVGIEVGALPADRDLAQQACALELMQGVIDGCQRHPFACAHRLLVQQLGRDMAIAIGEQQGRERDPLPRRAQSGAP